MDFGYTQEQFDAMLLIIKQFNESECEAGKYYLLFDFVKAMPDTMKNSDKESKCMVLKKFKNTSRKSPTVSKSNSSNKFVITFKFYAMS